MRPKSNLDLVNECDNFPYQYPDAEAFKTRLLEYYEFRLEDCDSCLGYVRAEIAQRFPITKHWSLDDDKKHLIFQPRSEEGSKLIDLDNRNRILALYLQEVREKRIFKVLTGWRNEEYPIYGPNRELVLSMERSATPLFGVVSYGVHMTAYVKTLEGMKIWTPRRAETKQTYPGMMDNTVAGGLSTGEEPFDCLMRECEEEASLLRRIAEKAKPCGTLTYFHVRDSRAGGETGLCQPECQYIYDLELPTDVTPKPGDDEAVDFCLLSVREVQDGLAGGKFKPNCALLLLEFLVRHAIVTPETEPHYIEIVSRLHRRLEYPMR